MIWLFMVALIAILFITVQRKHAAVAAAFVLLIGVFAMFVSMQWGNMGLGL